MKKEFIGYYNPSEQEINEAWSNGTFAFDTNTLLNLYRYTEYTRKDFISALITIKEKLFLPHQAALEFHSNRIGVIEGIGYSYENLYNVFESNFEKNLKPQINQFKRHPCIIIENINKLHTEFLKKISLELEKQKKMHPDFKTSDEILNQLTDLFENATGKEFSKEEIKKIFNEGKDRYAENIPPGFKDLEIKRKRGDRHVYGDLIIWKELINYSKKEKKSLIFVTDDRKEDWWTIENGKTIRPREELIKEFYDLTGIRILIYNADQFLHYAKEKKLIPHLKSKTIKEVKEVRISDERTFNIYTTYQNSNPFSTDILASDEYDWNSARINQSNQITNPLLADILENDKYGWISAKINQSYQNANPLLADVTKQSYQGNHIKPFNISDIQGSQSNEFKIPSTNSDIRKPENESKISDDSHLNES